MKLSNAEAVRREAIVSVFARLGDENLTSLKSNVKNHGIDLDKDALFKLEELRIALDRILGAGGAELLMREI